MYIDKHINEAFATGKQWLQHVSNIFIQAGNKQITSGIESILENSFWHYINLSSIGWSI